VLRTWARGAPGFPAVLIALLTRLGYRWYPEYMVYEDYREFYQEEYHADVRIYDQRDDSDTELHLFHGIGVTIEMAVHDAAYSAVARLRGWQYMMPLSSDTFRMPLLEILLDTTQLFVPRTSVVDTTCTF
jgi:hypothetical protein